MAFTRQERISLDRWLTTPACEDADWEEFEADDCPQGEELDTEFDRHSDIYKQTEELFNI